MKKIIIVLAMIAMLLTGGAIGYNLCNVNHESYEQEYDIPTNEELVSEIITYLNSRDIYDKEGNIINVDFGNLYEYEGTTFENGEEYYKVRTIDKNNKLHTHYFPCSLADDAHRYSAQ